MGGRRHMSNTGKLVQVFTAEPWEEAWRSGKSPRPRRTLIPFEFPSRPPARPSSLHLHLPPVSAVFSSVSTPFGTPPPTLIRKLFRCLFATNGAVCQKKKKKQYLIFNKYE